MGKRRKLDGKQANYEMMSDSVPPPDSAPQPDDVPATKVPDSSENETDIEEIEIPHDPAALAADRAGFKFLAIGFLIFFIVIVICASVVAIAMKRMGI